MFPRAKRLSRAHFPTPQAKSRRVSSVNFTIVVPDEASGYAVVISKKVAKLSVTRHKVKRRVLSALRTIALSGQALPSSLVIYPRAPANNLDFTATKEELTILLSKILK